MITIQKKTLPGELEGNFDPEAYGFAVVRDDVPSNEEAAARVGLFYSRMKEQMGLVVPNLEPYLSGTPIEELREASAHG